MAAMALCLAKADAVPGNWGGRPTSPWRERLDGKDLYRVTSRRGDWGGDGEEACC